MRIYRSWQQLTKQYTLVVAATLIAMAAVLGLLFYSHTTKANTFNGDGVSLEAPSVTTNGGAVKYDWKVTTNRSVSFRYLQVAVRPTNDTGFHPNTTINGQRSFSTNQTLPNGNYTAFVAYVKQGTTKWVNGPAASFTVGSTPAPDTTAPTVSLTAPAGNTSATIGDTVNLAANASDNVGVTRVEFVVNDTTVATYTSAPYAHSWNTTGLSAGAHTVTAKAYDAAGNLATSTARTVTLSAPTPVDPSFNADGVRLTPPTVHIMNGNKIRYAWVVTTNKRVHFQHLQLSVRPAPAKDIGFRANTILNGTGAYNTDGGTLPNGDYTARVVYRKQGAPTWVNGPITNFTVGPTAPEPEPGDTTAPTVSLTAPANNSSATIGATVPISANASDNVGVTKVEFLVNGAVENTDTSAPYTYNWNTAGLATGTYTLAAKAYDAAGNSTVSATRTVTLTTPSTPNPDRPSGMIFNSGAYTDHQASVASQFETMRGAKLDVISVFPAKASWDTLLNPWWLNAAPADFEGTLSVAMPLWPYNGNVDAAARGDYNQQWREMGAKIASQYPDAYVRIGWEMNLPNSWHANPDNKDKWIQAFRLAATNVKHNAPNLRIVFNPSGRTTQTGLQADQVYPGNEYVDVIGIDSYDWWPPLINDANWQRTKEEPYRWDWWLNFAKSKGKKFAVPEWGLARHNGSPNPHNEGGGDNPKYFNYKYAWMKANAEHIEYEAYFNEPMDYIQNDLITQNPLGRASYQNWVMNQLKQ